MKKFLFLFLVSKIFKHHITVSPVVLNLYPKFKKNFGMCKLFKVVSCLRTYLFKHFAFFTYNNCLVRITFTVYSGSDFCKIFFFIIIVSPPYGSSNSLLIHLIFSTDDSRLISPKADPSTPPTPSAVLPDILNVS